MHRNMIDSYICEFVWRKRNKDKNLFEEILNDIAQF